MSTDTNLHTAHPSPKWRGLMAFLLPLTLTAGLGLWSYPESSYAQEAGTLIDCIEGFEVTLALWDSETAEEGRNVICQANKGKALVGLRGVSRDDPVNRRITNLELIREQDFTGCIMSVFRDETSPKFQDQVFFSISGGDAAAWNRFLKGDGCQIAMDLVP
jgi:hypothetical protein